MNNDPIGEAERISKEAVKNAISILEATPLSPGGSPQTPAQAAHAASGAFTATSGGDGQYEPAPTGSHCAVLYGMVNIGLQESPYGISHKILFLWEILGDARKTNGEPFTLSKTFTLSTHRKATLRQTIDSWRGDPMSESEARAFDVRCLHNLKAQLQVSHKQSQQGRMYANIAGVFPAPTGSEMQQGTFEPILYDANSQDLALYEKLPGWVQRICDDRVREIPSKHRTGDKYIHTATNPDGVKATPAEQHGQADGIPF